MLRCFGRGVGGVVAVSAGFGGLVPARAVRYATNTPVPEQHSPDSKSLALRL